MRLPRDLVIAAGRALESTPPTAKVDLAWRGKSNTRTIAEVKSLTDDNEAHQLRYGLGQLLDYRQEVTDAQGGGPPRCVLAIPRAPHRLTWLAKCEAAGVQLCWPGHWPSLP